MKRGVGTPTRGASIRGLKIPLLLVLAIWSRVWIGWWCLVPVGVVVVWTLVNPRVFPVPRTLDSWASRAVLGETAWGRRSQTPVPKTSLGAGGSSPSSVRRECRSWCGD
ncbi:MAG: DUF6653 family protein [Mycobacterium sp.]